MTASLRARATQLAQVDGGVLVAPLGKLAMVPRLSFREGRIAEIDLGWPIRRAWGKWS